MKLEDYGINPQTRQHNRNLTVAENRFLGILWIDHVGKDNKISADALAVSFDNAMRQAEIAPDNLAMAIFDMRNIYPKVLNGWKREVRYMQNHLLFGHRLS